MAATASNQRNVDIVRQFNDVVFNGRDYDRISDFRSEEYVQHGPTKEMGVLGNEEALQTMQMFHGAFSDLNATEEMAFGDGDYVCTHYTYRGTHDGDLMGIPATDAECDVSGTVVSRIADGKIVESWYAVDLLSLLQQVGAVPSMDDVAA